MRVVEDGSDLVARAAQIVAQSHEFLEWAIVQVEAEADETAFSAGDQRALACRVPLEEHVAFEERRQGRSQLAQIDEQASRGLRTATRDERGKRLVPPLDDDGPW